jgi:hypothetical protein
MWGTHGEKPMNMIYLNRGCSWIFHIYVSFMEVPSIFDTNHPKPSAIHHWKILCWWIFPVFHCQMLEEAWHWLIITLASFPIKFPPLQGII